jgi:glycyl-tRNA synthetase beta chain
MSTHNLLVELLVEELPPKALRHLGDEFARRLFEGLKERNLATSVSVTTAFATPRRLAAHISHVLAVSPDREHVERLMPASVAVDSSGSLTPAAHKRCEKIGRGLLAARWPAAEDGPDRLFLDGEGKDRALFFRTLAAGQLLGLGLQSALEDALDSLPIPKVMSYQLADGWTGVRFVRPAHGLVALHGADVVPVSVLGLEAGRETKGHRFEAPMTPVKLLDADHYARVLDEQGAVIVSFEHRRAEIARQLQHAAHQQGLQPIDDDALLDEVTALVERPNVLRCRFDAAFLEVPSECLILTMKANQKYFPLLDAQGRLTNQFLVVSNIRPADASAVIQGNERVVRPRLADAKFFFDQDRKRTLESRVAGLDKVVYHARLGSMGERVARVRAIARTIGEQLGGSALAALADRAAALAKADLVTDMVGEFPELQGVMGGYYARHDGETEAVAFAIEDHYRPRFAGDALPRHEVGLVVALADKLETLVGLFGVGQAPTGDKDPFALRRHALGVLRMLIERAVAIDLPDLIHAAQRAFAGRAGWSPVEAELQRFFMERLAVLLRDQGSSAQEVDAVLGLAPPRMSDIPTRLAAVRAFAGMAESSALAAANKRIGNILKKSDAVVTNTVAPALFAEAAERTLHDALSATAPRADALFEQRDYTASLRELAALKGPVDAFFDQVMVNADDPALRANRLALLAALHRAMNRVADLARLAG